MNNHTSIILNEKCVNRSVLDDLITVNTKPITTMNQHSFTKRTSIRFDA